MSTKIAREFFPCTIAAVALLHGCDPNCNMYYHVDRIMEGQRGVIDCGRHSINDTAARADAVAECVNNAIQSDTPFRVEPNMNFPGGPQMIVVGRQASVGYELIAVAWVEANSTRQYVSANKCSRPGPYRKDPFGPGFLLRYDCPEQNRMGPLPTQPPYNPPQSVPNGALCGVMY